MKTRTALPLIYALSFLMVAAATGSAQLNPATPDPMALTLDSSFFTYNMNDATIPQRTVRGSIVSFVFTGSFTVNLQSAPQWVISTKINGVAVQDGDMVGISQGQTLPVEIMITPYAERPDTENYCLFVKNGSKTMVGECITLTVTNTKSAVSTDLPAPNITVTPNPAGSYISVRGLSNEQSGYRYEIFSISGAEIRQGILPSDARINVQDLSSGAYRLLLFDGKRMLSNSAITILH